jgi:hypothetical protein
MAVEKLDPLIWGSYNDSGFRINAHQLLAWGYEDAPIQL